ncbi:MAG: hypothetical protein KAI33_00705, partial [Elusimicrobiales bacterium]|nr:hypothetical protein [Elusimicrobiales bacterium]
WDIEGKILKKCDVRAFKRQELKQIISFMTGKITQEVPSFSAVRYKGKHLYKLARKNLAIPVIKRQVNVKWLKYSYKKPVMSFEIECSGGTYIRSIAHEIGVMLGCGGRLSGLRRLKVGLWDIKRAVDSDFLSRSSYEQIKSRIMDIPDDLKYR